MKVAPEKDHPVAIHHRSYNHTLDDYNIITVDKEMDETGDLILEEV